MNRSRIILIVILGFFLMPTMTFACEKIVINHSCTKETSKSTKEDDCCSKTNHSGDKDHDGCGGKCGHSRCGCASVCSGGITFLHDLEFKNITIGVFSLKQKFHNAETSILSGFYSIWLIPKIS